MAPPRETAGSKVLGDVTNTSNTVDPSNQVLDPKERKRQRDKARYAALSEEQKSERRKKQREAYHAPEAVEKRREARNKSQRETVLKENVEPTDHPLGSSLNATRNESLREISEDCLNTNDSHTLRLMPTISSGVSIICLNKMVFVIVMLLLDRRVLY